MSSDQLRMYTDDYDTVIATSPEDATAAWCEHIGPGADPSHLEWNERHEPLTADIEGKTNGAETHPPEWWIERFGRGFLCSTEW